MKFKRLSDKVEVNLIEYASEFLKNNPGHKVYVGTDSQNIGRKTIYATVIVFHNSGIGGHVLFYKREEPIIRDRFSRLWKEVELSVEAAEQFKGIGIPPIECIDLDLNPDPKYKSNQVLRSALGYVESLGYKARIKPESVMATCVADKLF